MSDDFDFDEWAKLEIYSQGQARQMTKDITALQDNLAICHRQYQAEEDESTRLHEQYDDLRTLVDELIEQAEVNNRFCPFCGLLQISNKDARHQENCVIERIKEDT